ncbi:MAG: tetratricopeptide repeat protein [Sphingobacterium sp.]
MIKRIKYIGIILLSTVFYACTNNGGISTEKFVNSNDSVFYHIEADINQSFIQSFASQNLSPLKEVDQKISKLNDPLADYWKGYIAYLQSIFYLTQGKKDSSFHYIDNAISKLKNEKLSSDGNALVGTMYSFSAQFRSGVMIAASSKKATDFFQTSLDLDSTNIRSYLGLATNDYYTPEKYGGKKKVESLLLKALEQPDRISTDTRLPSWGRDQVYELLIRHYIDLKKMDLAIKYYKEAIALYPNNYQLIRLSKSLIS